MSNDGTEAIQVVVRIRPIQKHEKAKGEKICVKPISDGKEIQIKTDTNEAIVYKCNQCFSRDTTQADFFVESTVTNLIDSAINGYRACVFAFGQTGAGKTYTVVGPSRSISPGEIDDGLIGRSLDYLFNRLDALNTRYNVRISCTEIYSENVFDLLTDEKHRSPLPVREHAVEGFFLEGSKMVSCLSFKQACSIIDIAMRNRHIAEHELNSRSSRSHCITEVYIDIPTEINEDEDDQIGKKNKKAMKKEYSLTGKLTMVDLAGSERLKSTKSSGKRLQETGFINKSLNDDIKNNRRRLS